MKKINLLIVEDEKSIRDVLRLALPPSNFIVLDAQNSAQAMQMLTRKIPDLILLDWMLPSKSGIDFLKWLKQQELYKNIPVIMLTAKVEEENKIQGLMTGADDYVTKPFSPNELLARIKTILRRGALISASNEIQVGDLVINVEQCQVQIKNHPLKLTPIEYKLLYFFVKHPNKSYTRDQLITHVWGINIIIDERTVDVQIKRLRNKLSQYGYHGCIKSVRGVGYLFDNGISFYR